MRKITWIVICVVVFSGFVFSQSITVTKPIANELWYRGESYTITWTKSGSMPNQVRIALVNETANDIVQNIETETPNDGNHPWAIPMDTPLGRYKIAIRAKGSSITGVSSAFNIQVRYSTARTVPPPPKPPKEHVELEPRVMSTQPDSNDRWNFGSKKDILIETNVEVHYFRIDLTQKGERVFPIHEGAISPYSKENITHTDTDGIFPSNQQMMDIIGFALR